MGMIAKRATARQLAPMVVPVGSWIDDFASCGLPGPAQLLAAACYEAVLAIDVGKAKSSTTEHTSTTVRSLLQVRALPKGVVIGFGAASFRARFMPDWNSRCGFRDPAGGRCPSTSVRLVLLKTSWPTERCSTGCAMRSHSSWNPVRI